MDVTTKPRLASCWRSDTAPALGLLLLAPVCGELLTGSTPPPRFFRPAALIVFLLFYGGGTLLIREARTRWRLQWPVLCLAVAYGIVEEGIMMQSFFSPHHPDLRVMARYGMYAGVQWPWTLGLLFYHATMSTLIPLAVVDLWRPAARERPWLSAWGIGAALAGLLVVTVALMLNVWTQEHGKADPYRPDPLLLGSSVLVVVGLVGLAYRLRCCVWASDHTRLRSPRTFGLVGFLAQAGNLILPQAFAGAGVPALITLVGLLAGLAASLWFLRSQLCHRHASPAHHVAVVYGSLVFYILLTPLRDWARVTHHQPFEGMSLVGLGAMILLTLWKRAVARTAGAVGAS